MKDPPSRDPLRMYNNWYTNMSPKVSYLTMGLNSQGQFIGSHQSPLVRLCPSSSSMAAMANIWNSSKSKSCKKTFIILVTSRVIGRGHRIGPVCVSVSTFTAELFDEQTKTFTWRSAWTISRSSSMGKVIGQRSRSRGQKTWFPGFWLGTSMYNLYSLWCDVMTFVLWISVSIHHGKRTFRHKVCAWGERGRCRDRYYVFILRKKKIYYYPISILMSV